MPSCSPRKQTSHQCTPDCFCKDCGKCKADCPCDWLDYAGEAASEGGEQDLEVVEAAAKPLGQQVEGAPSGDVDMEGGGDPFKDMPALEDTDDEVIVPRSQRVLLKWERRMVHGQSSKVLVLRAVDSYDAALHERRVDFRIINALINDQQLDALMQPYKHKELRRFSHDFATGLTAIGQALDAEQLTAMELQWGMACRQHGLCDHVTADCNGGWAGGAPRNYSPADVTMNPSFRRHLDFGEGGSGIINVLFNYGLRPALEQGEYTYVVDLIKEAYGRYSDEYSATGSIRRFCKRQVRLMEELGYDTFEAGLYKRRRSLLGTLHKTLHPESLTAKPWTSFHRQVAGRCTEALMKPERERWEAIMGLSFIAAAAPAAAAVPPTDLPSCSSHLEPKPRVSVFSGRLEAPPPPPPTELGPPATPIPPPRPPPGEPPVPSATPLSEWGPPPSLVSMLPPNGVNQHPNVLIPFVSEACCARTIQVMLPVWGMFEAAVGFTELTGALKPLVIRVTGGATVVKEREMYEYGSLYLGNWVAGQIWCKGQLRFDLRGQCQSIFGPGL